MIVTVPWVLLVPSVTEVAMMVTDPPLGTATGAVYIVAAPLAVFVGLNEPHDPDGVQLQFTPPAAESFVTFAVIEAVPPAVNELGGEPDAAKLTAMAGGGGGGVLLPPPPQAHRNAVARMNRETGFQFTFFSGAKRGDCAPVLSSQQFSGVSGGSEPLAASRYVLINTSRRSSTVR